MSGIKNFTDKEVISIIDSWRRLTIENHINHKSKLRLIAELVSEEHRNNGYNRTAEQVRRKIKAIKGGFKKVCKVDLQHAMLL